ncbi:MAG: hypothetical protein KAJ33_01320 [Thermoplasmata archaeon]|nr:hypothetical protein [Thermoplasmata archaeon]MCK5396873.1 hypothetical protein [Thermoplasmata archaeon]
MKNDKEDNGIVLTVGSRYSIKSLESRDKPLVSSGKFLGYTAIGHDEGMAMELNDTHGEEAGRVRIIPTHTIISIDIIEAAEKTDKKKPDSGTMFG